MGLLQGNSGLTAQNRYLQGPSAISDVFQTLKNW